MSEEVTNFKVGQTFEGEVNRLDPAEVERIMVEKEQQQFQKGADPIEISSMMMKLYYPRFVALVNEMSAKQAKRMLKSLVGYPLEGKYEHSNKIEQEAFGIGSSLLDAKQVLIMATYHENAEKILQQAAQAAGNATIETVRGEEALNLVKEEENVKEETQA